LTFSVYRRRDAEKEREELLREAGDVLRRVAFPVVHPGRKSSKWFYEIVFEEDAMHRIRAKRVEGQ
jgi:hypothetical protein